TRNYDSLDAALHLREKRRRENRTSPDTEVEASGDIRSPDCGLCGRRVIGTTIDALVMHWEFLGEMPIPTIMRRHLWKTPDGYREVLVGILLNPICVLSHISVNKGSKSYRQGFERHCEKGI
ncbi:hypothetical protein Csa_023693, partial [Cucumis sativus]